MLIRMLPLEFFIDIVTKIILYSALAGVALTGFGFWGSKKDLREPTCSFR